MTHTLRAAACAFALALLPATAAESDNNRDDIKPADLVHILIGAYEGAADAADRSGHPFGDERLSHEQLMRFEANFNQVQQGLQNITRPDGSIDGDRAAALLNELQDRHGDGRTIDFVRALNTLRQLEQQPDGLSLDNIIAFLAAKKHDRSSTIAHDDNALPDLLKLVYADRQLGTPDPAREARAHRLIAETLVSDTLSPARHAEIATLLDKLGAPYRDDYLKWQATPPRIAIRPQSSTDTLEQLTRDNPDLTPDQRARIQQILREQK